MQLIDFFKCCHAAQLFYTDVKLANFLVEEDESSRDYQLKVIDLKSMQSISQGDYFRFRRNKRCWDKTLFYTEGIAPPELRQHKPCSIEKTNVFMLGISLYTALTESRLHYKKEPYAIEDLTEEHFKHSFFTSPEGAVFKPLLKQLLDKDASKRPSYESITQFFERLYPVHVEKRCRTQIQ